MPTIYRQYRPQRFDEVSGQTHITDTLKQAVLKDRISHAYLFQGPRGTGKTSTARIFAKRINCSKSKEAEACGKCPTCVATQNNQNIDIIEIDAASNRGIDDIRALRENSNLSPAIGKYKVYIIDEVHMLTNEAFAALLKVLEEPVKHIIFILATTELHKVPATILSRCQLYRFRRATEEEMRNRLTHILQAEKREADKEVLDFIISHSDGCYRDAESLLGQLLVTDKKTISKDVLSDSLGLPSVTHLENFLSALIVKNAKEAVDIIDTMYNQGFDPEQCIQESIRMSRDAAMNLAKGDSVPSFAANPAAATRLPDIIRALVQASQDLAFVPQPVIALQLVAITVCRGGQARAAAQTTQPVATQQSAPQPKPVQQPKPQPSVVQDAPAPTVPGVISLDQAKQAWPELIQEVKKSNAVASTFLRAVEPKEINGNEIVLRVSYPLHRTFFEKPEQKKIVEEALSKLVEQQLTIRCQLETAFTASAPAQAKQEAPTKPFMPKPNMQFQPKPAAQSEPKPTEPAASPIPQDNAVYEMTKEVFG